MGSGSPLLPARLGFRRVPLVQFRRDSPSLPRGKLARFLKRPQLVVMMEIHKRSDSFIPLDAPTSPPSHRTLTIAGARIRGPLPPQNVLQLDLDDTCVARHARSVLIVLVTRPKLPVSRMLRSGAPRFTWLKKLKNSARNCT